MRRIILLSVIVLLPAACDAHAQRHGGMAAGSVRGGMGRGGFAINRVRAARPGRGYGYLPGGGYLPYDEGGTYGYAPEPSGYAAEPMVLVEQPPPPAVVEPPPREVHPVVTNYTWPAHAPVAAAEGTLPTFGIVLRDGSTLAAVTVVAAGDVLQVVDPEERHLRISMNEVDRAATLKLDRERGLTLYLPATP